MSKLKTLFNSENEECKESNDDDSNQLNTNLANIEIYQAPVLLRFGNMGIRIEQIIDQETKVTTGLDFKFFSDDLGDEVSHVNTLSTVNKGEKKNLLLLKMEDLYVLPVCDEILDFVEEHEGEIKEMREIETYGTLLLQ